MKRKLLKFVAVLFLGLFLSGQASAQAYTDATNYVRLGVGFPSLLTIASSSLSGISNTTSSSSPPFSITFDHAITDKMSLGAYLGYATAKSSYVFPEINVNTLAEEDVTFSESESFLIIGLRYAYHFSTGDHFDPYIGVMLGYNIVGDNLTSSDPTNYPYTGGSGSGSGITYSLYLGANYYITDNFGLYAELGYGVAIVNLGAVLKF